MSGTRPPLRLTSWQLFDLDVLVARGLAAAVDLQLKPGGTASGSV